MPQEIVFCKGGGCTAKLGPDLLSNVLAKLPRGEKDSNLLIGYDSCDDAAVYKISDDTAVVQTLDFFPPMVDDPYTFGQIAAANALSDIYPNVYGSSTIGGKKSSVWTIAVSSEILYTAASSLLSYPTSRLLSFSPFGNFAKT